MLILIFCVFLYGLVEDELLLYGFWFVLIIIMLCKLSVFVNSFICFFWYELKL